MRSSTSSRRSSSTYVRAGSRLFFGQDRSSDCGRVSQNLSDNLPPQDHAGKGKKRKEEMKEASSDILSTIRVGSRQIDSRGESEMKDVRPWQKAF